MLEPSKKESPVPQCPSCAEPVDRRHRFCPWCAAPLRRKLVEFFAPHAGIADDAVALRVSRYLGGDASERHTRLSIWDREQAVSAISLDDRETRRLARFLSEGAAAGTGEETAVMAPRGHRGTP
jgi:hypothetical protein